MNAQPQPRHATPAETPLSDEERIARDFSEFAYVVSHDFNAPLRQIREFTRLLLTRLEGRIGEPERKYARFIQDNVRHAEAMLEGLLAYSRLNTRCEPFSEVDCNALLEEVQQTLQRKIEESNASIDCGPLPAVQGDRGQLKQLFYQLLDNALKFSRRGTPPQISVHAERRDDCWHFCVADNGIGILPEMQEAVFVLFKQLHDEDAYPGSGVGLTLCRKVAERHGGSLKVESDGNTGTNVWVTLPA